MDQNTLFITAAVVAVEVAENSWKDRIGKRQFIDGSCYVEN